MTQGEKLTRLWNVSVVWRRRLDGILPQMPGKAAIPRETTHFSIASVSGVLYISASRREPHRESGMDLSLRVRLSAMMFLQYFVWGAWAVAFGTFLSALPTAGGFLFPGDAVGLLYGTSSIGAMISPLFVGLFADRLFSTEKVLAVFHLVGAGLLGGAAWLCQTNLPATQQLFEALAKEQKVPQVQTEGYVGKPQYERTLWDSLQLQRDLETVLSGGTVGANARDEIMSLRNDNADGQNSLRQLKAANEAGIQKIKDNPQYKELINRTYYPLLWIMLAYALFYMPTLTLSNSISFRNMSDPDKYFGSIRVLGTIGWIAAGLVVGFLLMPTSPQPLYLAAIASLGLGVFCFVLPKTPPTSDSKSVGDMLGLPALAMLKSPPFLVFFVCSFLLMIPLAFYYAWANKFLTDINAPYPTALQTIGQVSEIFFMLAIPFCLKRFGTKGMLLIGMAAWVVRYAAFASMNIPAVVAVGLPLHGVCYDFFFVVSYLYVDRKAPKHLRASAQGIITFITLGVGQFLGNYLSGSVKDFFAVGDTIKYQQFWLVPLAIAAGATVLFALLFHDKTADAPAAAGTVPEDDEYRRTFEKTASDDPHLLRTEDGLQK
jgi:nucleoside transporter